MKLTTLVGPIVSPAKEYIPVADGIFSFDGVKTFWASFSIGTNESHGIFHTDKGVTHVIDLKAKTDTAFETRDEEGYLVQTKAVPPGQKTWGVLKRLSRHDHKLSLTFASIELLGGEIVTTKLSDALLTANSEGLPGVQCDYNGRPTLLTFNTDDYNGPFQRYYNITAIDVTTGLAVWNRDTLVTLPGTHYAFVSGFACYGGDISNDT